MIKNYYKATPKKWRKLGDSLLLTMTGGGAGSLFFFSEIKEVFGDSETKAIIGTMIFLGITGKFLTNFFKEE